jgi:DNA ligase D-like protein (predicted ligase)
VSASPATRVRGGSHKPRSGPASIVGGRWIPLSRPQSRSPLDPTSSPGWRVLRGSERLSGRALLSPSFVGRSEATIVDANLICHLLAQRLRETGLLIPEVKIKADFVEPMLLLRTERLPQGGSIAYELKLDGFRAEAIKSGGRVHLRSRNDKDFNARYPAIVQALAAMPDETVIDGEIVALDESGRPSFNAKNHDVSTASVVYYVFDVMILAGKDVMNEPLSVRRELLLESILAKLDEPIRELPELEASLPELIRSVKAHGLEGLVAKRRVSRYEPGQRSGAWQKMRVNQGQAFVIAGYTVAPKSFDAIVFGYYDGGKLMYAGRTRNGFTPSSREQLFKRFKPLAAEHCPFANLPEARSGRWGQGLTAEKMKECRWLKPALVGQFEFVEWTPDAHLRHARFMGLREDKKPREVVREA